MLRRCRGSPPASTCFGQFIALYGHCFLITSQILLTLQPLNVLYWPEEMKRSVSGLGAIIYLEDAQSSSNRGVATDESGDYRSV